MQEQWREKMVKLLKVVKYGCLCEYIWEWCSSRDIIEQNRLNDRAVKCGQSP